jgi:hypothetical protein
VTSFFAMMPESIPLSVALSRLARKQFSLRTMFVVVALVAIAA